ncbi:unnamed protein product [Adineta ricciae]|uniref:GIY-YIG domain-containing protein n=1 Tax=Adineta ricciae TaxID=249248 RepID=A0A814TRT0_ADIRI|nr:unnamed protein product [Adineta ricciae]CAF1511497.1 unnamed protein product [Adineta ricciae]
MNHYSTVQIIPLTNEILPDMDVHPEVVTRPSINRSSSRYLRLTTAPYVSTTLRGPTDRYRILPAYPTSIFNDQPSLLLPNVPRNKLSEEQLACRTSGHYPLIYTLESSYFDIPSYFRNDYQEYISSLIYKYNIDEPILDYNLARFKQCYDTFIDDYCYHHSCSPEHFELNTKQKNYAVEFYLQMDVDLFFMKTCSYRSATVRSDHEGLYCMDEPEARYGLLPCNKCSLCRQSTCLTLVQSSSSSSSPPPPPPPPPLTTTAVQFGPKQRYRFMNHYETILNCPATCQTRNIIYVLTCSCRTAEYIGETSQRLSDRLWHHRQHFNRIFHEFLIGERNVKLSQSAAKSVETIRKDRMRLYRHATRCPHAMQLFVSYNPIYSCFIPVAVNEAIRQNRTYILPPSMIVHDKIQPTSIGTRNRHHRRATSTTRSDEAARSCMRNLPPSPTGYTFSIRQRIEQFQYFKQQSDIHIKPNQSNNLFNSTIIAVLPTDAVDIVRRFVEALFITHTEANLNIAGRLFNNRQTSDAYKLTTNLSSHAEIQMSMEEQIEDRGNWCHNLLV